MKVFANVNQAEKKEFFVKNRDPIKYLHVTLVGVSYNDGREKKT